MGFVPIPFGRSPQERFPGMTITYGLMEKLESVAERGGDDSPLGPPWRSSGGLLGSSGCCWVHLGL